MFVVLGAVGAIVERQEIDNDLRFQLEGTTAHVNSLKMTLAEVQMGRQSVPMNAPGVLDTGTTQSWPWSNGERIGQGA